MAVRGTNAVAVGGGGVPTIDPSTLTPEERDRAIASLLSQLAGLEQAVAALGRPGPAAVVDPDLLGGPGGSGGNPNVETGVLVDTLYGWKGGVGYPIAFDRPAGEDPHDLFAHGDAWAVGYMEEIGGRWRPVCPVSVYIPDDDEEEEEEEPTGGGGRGRTTPRQPRRKTLAEPVASLSIVGGFQENPVDPDVGDDRRGKRDLNDPDEIPPCDEQTQGGPPTHVPAIAESPGAKARVATGSQSRLGQGEPRLVPPQPDPGLAAGQGRSRIQPAPLPVDPDGDARQRLGGGPWMPRAPLVPRGGIRTLDGTDFVARRGTVWDAVETISNRLNQVISQQNDARPFGPSALDDAGLFLPPQRRDLPQIPGAFDGTIAQTVNRDGEVQAWVKDRGAWKPHAWDFARDRFLGPGQRGVSVLARYLTGETTSPQMLPAFGWDARARAMGIRNADLDVDGEVEADGVGVRLPAGGRFAFVPDGDDLVVEQDDGGGTTTEHLALTNEGLLALGGRTGGVALKRLGAAHLEIRASDDAYTGTVRAGIVESVKDRLHKEADHSGFYVNRQAANITKSRDREEPDADGTYALTSLTSGQVDHGALAGLADDDHTQYLLAAGTRASTGQQEFSAGLEVTGGTAEFGEGTTEGHRFKPRRMTATEADTWDETAEDGEMVMLTDIAAMDIWREDP